jgi:hypothetical protein
MLSPALQKVGNNNVQEMKPMEFVSPFIAIVQLKNITQKIYYLWEGKSRVK